MIWTDLEKTMAASMLAEIYTDRSACLHASWHFSLNPLKSIAIFGRWKQQAERWHRLVVDHGSVLGPNWRKWKLHSSFIILSLITGELSLT